MDWIIPGLAIAISAIFSVVFTLIYAERLKKAMGEDLDVYINDIQSHISAEAEALEVKLKPILDNNSRVMGIIANVGVNQKAERKGLQLLGEDIIDNNELLITAVETVSPKLAEYLTDNPEQILNMLPRIQAIAEKAGIDLTELGFPSPSSRTHQPHPFGMKEE